MSSRSHHRVSGGLGCSFLRTATLTQRARWEICDVSFKGLMYYDPRKRATYFEDVRGSSTADFLLDVHPPHLIPTHYPLIAGTIFGVPHLFPTVTRTFLQICDFVKVSPSS